MKILSDLFQNCLRRNRKTNPSGPWHWSAITQLRPICLASLLIGAFSLIASLAQASSFDSVLLWEVAITNNPPTITLSWEKNTNQLQMIIGRRDLTNDIQSPWTLLLNTTNEDVNIFIDSDVELGKGYEYIGTRSLTNPAAQKIGYLASGIELPLVESRGKLLMIFDGGFTDGLSYDYDLLTQDMVGDGWTVLRHDVPRSSSSRDIRNLIHADYTNDPDNVNTIFLFGRLPVAKSGPISPDGHADHRVCYATDSFYGDMGILITNYVPAATNFWSYWKADQYGNYSNIQACVDLAVGRVDLSFLPAMNVDEAALLRQYIQKDHNFRHRLFDYQEAGIIEDQFLNFAQSAWITMCATVGPTNVFAARWKSRPALPYLWAYGNGGGFFTSCGTVISTAEMKTHDPAIFTMLFGSYFGDWYTINNLMRAELATERYGLTCCWSGMPQYFLYYMGMGETIGDGVKRAINESFQIQTGLMGDPTLRLHYVPPPSNLVAEVAQGRLTWEAAPTNANVLGYHIYESTNNLGPFTRLNYAPVTTTNYIVDNEAGNRRHYMVRALALVTRPCGSYYDASQGIFTTGTFSPPLIPRASAGSYTDKIAVSWTPQHDSIAYEIWRAEEPDPDQAILIGQASTTNYNDTTSAPIKFYYYWIKAQTPTGTTDFKSCAEGWRSWLAMPADVKASDGIYKDKVRITWTPSVNAISYIVYRNTSSADSGAHAIGNTSDTSYDDTSATPGVVYTYWVVGINDAGYYSGFSVPDSGWRAQTPKPPDPSWTNMPVLRATDFQLEPAILQISAAPSLLTTRIMNTGPVATNAVLTMTLYLSRSGVFGDADNLNMGSVQRRISLAGSQSSVIQLSGAERSKLRVPATTLGSYTLFMKCTTPDAKGTNNVLTRAAPVQLIASRLANRCDFDGDGKSDLIVYDEGAGRWMVRGSATGRDTFFTFGGPGYHPLANDYDNDGKFDPVVYQSSAALWQVMLSGMMYHSTPIGNFGGPHYIPINGDFDGDGKADPALYDSLNGVWLVLLSGSGYAVTSATLGGAGCAPIAGDFDGDGLADPAVYQADTGAWAVLLSSQNYSLTALAIGGPGCRPVSGDFDGDGKSDPAIYEEASGIWTVLLSGSGYAIAYPHLGGPGWQPVAGDFDGDGKSDLIVYQPTFGHWHFMLSKSHYRVSSATFGGPTYQPVDTSY